MKILIINQDASKRLTLVDQISSLGFDIESATNAEDGYQKYLEISPNLLIADVNLELAERIRDYDADTGIVLLAKQNKPEYLLASAQLDVKFFTEPLNDSYVRKLLESFMWECENRSEMSRDSKLLEEYKKVVDASSIVSKTNTKGIITFVNDEFCKIAGYSKEELLGKNHNIVRHPNMPSAAFEDLWTTIKAKKIWKGVVENLKKDGGSYFVKATIVPVLDESNNIVEFIGLREDITDLMEKEKEIERLNAQNLKTVADKAFSIKTSQLLESIPTPLVSIDKDNNILQYNDEFHELFSIDTANEFLTNLSDNRANMSEIINFEKDVDEQEAEEELLDWKDEMIAFGDNLEVEFKHENSGRKFSLRIKEDQENNFIVAFAEESK
jgi:PAS domain S-box-containing protein